MSSTCRAERKMASHIGIRDFAICRVFGYTIMAMLDNTRFCQRIALADKLASPTIREKIMGVRSSS